MGICNVALESIEAILLVGDSFRDGNGGRNPYADRIEQIGRREQIARLRDHICNTVFLRSATLMERYFEGEWDPQMENGDENQEQQQQGGSGGTFVNGHGTPFGNSGSPPASNNSQMSPGGAPPPGSSHIPVPPNQAMVSGRSSNNNGGPTPRTGAGSQPGYRGAY